MTMALEELKGENSGGKNSDLKFQVYPVQPKPYKIEIDPITQALIDYNNELRRMLRLALNDLDKSIKACETDMLCEICSYEAECNCLNYCSIDKNLRSWKHHDEAMKLLGGAENAEN